MESNIVFKAIKERRSTLRYKPTPVPDDKLDMILQAGLWAPSWLNSQPWSFIVIKDPQTKKSINEIAATILGRGIEEAPVNIVVAVDTTKDPHHFIEDSAAATQNMMLAAHSLGLGSYWIGTFDIKNEKGSSEMKMKELLKLPEPYRIISLLPIGDPSETPTKSRKPLSEVVHKEQFGEK